MAKMLLVGCEPLLLKQEESGHIGLSAVVEAAVNPAVETIQRLMEEYVQGEKEVYFHECV